MDHVTEDCGNDLTPLLLFHFNAIIILRAPCIMVHQISPEQGWQRIHYVFQRPLPILGMYTKQVYQPCHWPVINRGTTVVFAIFVIGGIDVPLHVGIDSQRVVGWWPLPAREINIPFHLFSCHIFILVGQREYLILKKEGLGDY